MRSLLRKAALPLGIAHAVGAVWGMALSVPAWAANTPPAPAILKTSAPRDLQRERTELKNDVLENPEDPLLRFRLGKVDLALGDLDGAEKELKRAIELGRDGYETWLALGEVWLARGDRQRPFTDHELLKAETAAEKAGLATLQGNGRLVEGRWDDAQTLFESALREQPEYAPALVGVVEAAFGRGDLGAAELAIVQLEKAPEVDPVDLLRLKANLHMERGRGKQAVQLYRQATELRANDPVLLRGLAVAQLRSDHPAQADATLRRALMLQPQSADLLYLRSIAAYRGKDFQRAANLAGAASASPHANPQAAFIAGAASLATGAANQAQEYLRRYLARRPDDAQARRMLGEALLQLDRAGEAYAALKPLVKEAADSELLSRVAVAAAGAGAVDEAITYLKQAIALDPGNAQLKAQLAAASLATEERARGLAELDRLAAQDNRYALTALEAAADRLAQGEFDAAVKTARQVQDMAPDALEPTLIQAVALLRQGDLDAAEAAFQDVLEAQPDNRAAKTGMAEVLLRRGDTDQALARFEALASGNPQDVTARLNVAAAEMQAGRSLRAEQRLKRIVADNPESAAARVALAKLYLTGPYPARALDVLEDVQAAQVPEVSLVTARAELVRDRPAEAVALLEKVVSARPASLEARLELARAYDRDGETDKVQQTLEEALKIAPEQRDVQYALLRHRLIQPKLSSAALDQAVDEGMRFIEQEPADPRSQVLRGLLLYRTDGQREGGLRVLEQVYRAFPSADMVALLANLYAVAGQNHQAVELLNGYLATHDEDTYVRLRLARAQLGAGAYDAAADNLLRGIDQGARRQGLAMVTAWSLAQAGRPAQARRFLNQAESEGSSGVMLKHAKGLLRLDSGDVRGAIASLQQAVEESGDTPSARLRLDLAKALAAAGNRAQARRLVDDLRSEELGEADRAAVSNLDVGLR